MRPSARHQGTLTATATSDTTSLVELARDAGEIFAGEAREDRRTRDRVDELVHGLGLGVDAENTRVGRAQPDNLRIPAALTSLTLRPRVCCGAPARGG